ncbi:MAG: SBBP repeat-containing protein, partial [Chloroflexi bacterium]|nr:SBBP repeat-containing protein [Chloroflexota bacterium]
MLHWKAAVDAGGNIWVADTGNNRIVKYNAAGQYLTHFGEYGTDNGKFDQPSGVAVDGSGNIYVSEYNNHRIQKFNSSFQHQWTLGGYGSG